MELRAFIKSTILDLMSAIHEAQVEWGQGIGKGAINPVWDSTDNLSKHVHNLEFDIAVSASERVGGDVLPGIQVVGADLVTGGHAEEGRSGVSRIKFTIPIVAPVQIVVGGNKEAAIPGVARG